MTTVIKEYEPEQSTGVAVMSGTDTMMNIIAKASIDPSFDVEKLERLMGMYERMQAKQSEVEFNHAMSEMQADIHSIAERGSADRGKGGKLSYAKLEDILDVVRPVMHKHGFAISYDIENSASSVTATGILFHRAGHNIKTRMVLPADNSGGKNSVQSIGSSVSYAKRYVLNALLNLATRGEDDDGYGAVPDVSVTVAQAITMQKMLDKCKPATVTGFTNIYGQPSAVSKNDYNRAMAQLEVAVKRDSEAKSDAGDAPNAEANVDADN